MNNLSKLLMSSALCTVCTIASAQQVNVNGIVKDDNGEPVIGATVSVVGTDELAVTDMDGRFTPRTPIFRFVTFVSSVCTGSRATGEFARHRQTRCARCYAHCTRKRLPRQPACRIAQSSRSGWAVFVHNTRFLQTICTAGRFML